MFDEPQFNPQDGYIGFMLDFFRKLRAEGRLVFVSLHPTAGYHLEILREIADHFLFVAGGTVSEKRDFRALIADERTRAYLGPEMMSGTSPLLRVQPSTDQRLPLAFSWMTAVL